MTADPTIQAPPAQIVANPQARARLLDMIRFNLRGLVPCIAQQHDTGEVLMLAWMNRESIEETLKSGRMVYYSRSRKELWRKGETSGQVQALVDLRLDCDGDALLALVDQTGVACHTGRRNCFFFALRDGRVVKLTRPEVEPEELYGA
ncbi:phosphoribosyl-AMP cyclohydrolase [Siccirubricoccus phaeus]|uniref:phosphoribosyl-AMP cyclohydrolase n=1 Tax=Siccirubricoccus phaeus TaxID=2595053 RepID=UPI0011F3D21B|nr:phosphoribosyl-AMP cyclohydrolase [Siccirubricoccus phaeus]